MVKPDIMLIMALSPVCMRTRIERKCGKWIVPWKQTSLGIDMT